MQRVMHAVSFVRSICILMLALGAQPAAAQLTFLEWVQQTYGIDMRGLDDWHREVALRREYRDLVGKQRDRCGKCPSRKRLDSAWDTADRDLRRLVAPVCQSIMSLEVGVSGKPGLSGAVGAATATTSICQELSAELSQRIADEKQEAAKSGSPDQVHELAQYHAYQASMARIQKQEDERSRHEQIACSAYVRLAKLGDPRGAEDARNLARVRCRQVLSAEDQRLLKLDRP